MADKITIFSVGNGDTILLEADNKRILTDLNYREGSDDGKDDMLEFVSKIRSACSSAKLDIFVLTHPDEDHLRGFDKLFHTGTPSDWDSKGGTNDILLVNEIWCSSYAIDAAYDTNESKPLLDEIRRRNKLTGISKEMDGNRLRILKENSKTETGSDKVSALVLAPNADECDVGKGDDDNQPSANPTSLVIQWSIMAGERINKVLLGGDAPACVWERLCTKPDDYLKWDILIAPHHCSRYTLGSKNEDGKFIYSKDAIAALNHNNEGGYIVASSKKLKNNDDDPPSYKAKEKYVDEILDNKDNFLCTGGDNSSKAEHIIFEFTSSGCRKLVIVPAVAINSNSTGSGGSYG